MKNKMKKLVILSSASVLLCANVAQVSAAGIKDCFNAEYYSSAYSDLREAFGDNRDSLYKHYLEHGIKEGRQANPLFDVKVYRERYADLDALFGDNWDAYYEHYLTYGLYEGRSALASGEVFDAAAYGQLNPDVKEAVGDDAGKLFEHYTAFGYTEGRMASMPADDEDDKADTGNEGTGDADSGTSGSNTPGDSSGSDNTGTGDADSGTSGSNTSGDGSESITTDEWINNLYDSLLQDDCDGVMALLKDVPNVRERCAAYEDPTWRWPGLDYQTAYRLTAKDGTIFGIVVFDHGSENWLIAAFGSEGGFDSVVYGDHCVEMEYYDGVLSYSYLKDGSTIIHSDRAPYILEPNDEWIIWHV